MNKKKVLIFPPKGIGDITMHFPLINYFNNCGYEVIVIGVQSKYLTFLKDIGMISDFVIFKYIQIQSFKSFFLFFLEKFKLILKMNKFKSEYIFIINTKKTFFSFKIFNFLFRAKKYVFMSSTDFKKLNSYKFKNKIINQSEINNYLLKTKFNYKVRDEDFLFPLEFRNSLYDAQIFNSYNALNPFSKSSLRLINKKFYLDLINFFKGDYMLVGALENLEYSKNFISKNCINTTLSNSFLDSLKLIYNSSIFFTGDTGPMHLSLALGKRTVSFWGNITIPSMRIRKMPYSNEFILPDCVFGENSKYGFDEVNFFFKEIKNLQEDY